MFRPSALIVVFVALISLVGSSGCGSGKVANKPAEHDHHHHDDHGPNGGHVVELGDEEYHAEWLYDSDSGNVKIIILDDKMKKEVPIAASELTIETKVAGKENSYKLAATNPSAGEKPMAAHFEIEDKSLVTALKAAGKGGIEATLKVDVNGKAYAAKLEHHDHKH